MHTAMRFTFNFRFQFESSALNYSNRYGSIDFVCAQRRATTQLRAFCRVHLLNRRRNYSAAQIQRVERAS